MRGASGRDGKGVNKANGGRNGGVEPVGKTRKEEKDEQKQHRGHQQTRVATEDDRAGGVAAERDYWILTTHGHDPK